MSTQKPDRIAFLRQEHGAALLAAFINDDRNAPYRDWITSGRGEPLEEAEAVDALFKRYRGADPTPKGVCMQWLLRQALKGSLPAEDLDKARETLAAFQTYKRRLAPEARDLGRFDSLGAVWKAVEPFVQANEAVSGKDEERRLRDAVRAKSTIVLEKDGWTVAIPRTKRAAQWWGRGTRWCTTSERGTMFEHYTRGGPLIVFVAPSGEKHQFHARSGQFMDAADRRATLSVLKGIMPALEASTPGLATALTAVLGKRKAVIAAPTRPAPCSSRLRAALAFFGLGRTSAAPKQAAVQDKQGDGAATPVSGKDVWISAIGDFGLPLSHIPKPYYDAGIFEDIVARNGMAIQDIPHDAMTPDLCRLAVQQNGQALKHVPEHMRSREVALEAVRQDGMALALVPVYWRQRQICLAAVQQNPSALRHVPSNIADHEMYTMTATANPDLYFSLGDFETHETQGPA